MNRRPDVWLSRPSSPAGSVPSPPGCRWEGLRRLLRLLRRRPPPRRMFSAPSTFTCWTSASRGRRTGLLLRPQELRLSWATDFPPAAATGCPGPTPVPPSAASPGTLLRPRAALGLPLSGVLAAPTPSGSRALRSAAAPAKTPLLRERLPGGRSRSSCLAGRSAGRRGGSRRTSGRRRASPSWRGGAGEPSGPSGAARGRPRGSWPRGSR